MQVAPLVDELVRPQGEQASLAWYVIHTKPRQEARALTNLMQQGYQCFLPMITLEKLSRGRVYLVEEPIFPRYLFICLGNGRHGQNWAPIRSTIGVSGLVTFGSSPAKIHPDLIQLLLKQQEGLSDTPERLFESGERLLIGSGAFAGLEAVYQMASGDNRAMVLIELMGKLAPMQIAPASLRKMT
ncbi:NusG Transcription antiterminator [Methylophilaceae bacterium]